MTSTVRESLLIATTPRRAYEAVGDVTRMGRWSPEATGAELRTAGPIGVGSRFRGTNRRGRMTWTTECTVVTADPGREFAFEVRVLGGPVARWGYEFTEEQQGTRVTETWTDRRRGAHGFLIGAVAFLISLAADPRSGGIRDRSAHNREMMRTTLRSLKQHLESFAPSR
ncbi:polyketide cyclase/dehydrase/lipid transport protein [Halopolyspora algeriensis]|uniref:Polyketide cyclase/dehydrase/lipid transport protein n=1 Tax=Halopolyspora algeriensis TaxID=1500506 RepID=A0A368VSI2_9ACTN|nr:SRPBCC family protein [Halopolyspora algeriensis]RCW44095.1 polyketide cyclase/dehydrase/lipid transport protein [Halopolyspora algeriensis]TQM53406.1 polyketide cyclase/dehydrase/lipid transport protein [Halopolyspora algeriensis]